jgi:hypothetical protein
MHVVEETSSLLSEVLALTDRDNHVFECSTHELINGTNILELFKLLIHIITLSYQVLDEESLCSERRHDCELVKIYLRVSLYIINHR